jgi:hypothetical protein
LDAPSAALRQAQARIMKQNQRWRSPYYWAVFVLQGKYRERIHDEFHKITKDTMEYLSSVPFAILWSFWRSLFVR